jgi:hypothetical protein
MVGKGPDAVCRAGIGPLKNDIGAAPRQLIDHSVSDFALPPRTTATRAFKS